MAGRYSVSGKRHSLRRYVATTAAVAATCTVLAPLAMESRTIASTLASYVIGIGGNNDGASANIPHKLGGAYSVDYHPVAYPGAIWPVSGLTAPTFKTSVAQGHNNLNDEIVAAGNQPITIVGYSLGAVVVSKSHSDLQQQYPDGNPNIQFVLMGSANTPNGGIFARFPWLKIPLADIESNGAWEPDQFKTKVINTEYDTYGDFPAYFNPLALANSIAAIRYAHPDAYYDRIDPAALDDPDNPNVVKSVQGNTTYYLVRAEHLPLLQPLRDLTNPIGASFVLDAIEPTLRVFIDMAYDRDTSPGTTAQFSFFTPPKNIVDAFNKLPTAIAEGAHNVENGLADATPKQSASTEKPASPPVPQSGPTNPGSTTPQMPAPEAPAPSVISLTTAEPSAPPAPAKAADPTAISVSTTAASAASDQDFKPDKKPDPKSAPPSAKDSVEEADKSKNILKPTLRFPKISVAQPGTTPKSPKFPSLKDHLKSVRGFSEKKDPAADTSSKRSQPANAPTHTSDKASDHASETGRGAA
ncbi:PE-PPE domain-containing protein [Mycobacteroides abscessus]|uniref:PE-PPE domain-containing protein n=1 Tax=Mycobacteroides abscessus TaxID=36809 RepID=UPI00078EBCFA|nr:PE-PPE domain-containing protein [Mycobacteroides abscessus]AMU22801.1 PE-PPE domain-containing protein [Mycobacteroides abscessus]SHY52448.1 PE/PPE family protein [Mycobacteroides abscessus subsp. bolletii]SHY59950.1 PE/PPE family protein [Mycobacteroides abscessus subsp. bolletii]